MAIATPRITPITRESRAIPQTNRPALSHLSGRDRLLLASDLLPPCDFIAWLLAAMGSTILYTLIYAPDLLTQTSLDFRSMARTNLSLLAASLAPFVLYDQDFSNHASRGKSGALVRSFVFRFALTAVLVTSIANATQLLDTLPRAWLMMTFGGSLVLTASMRYFAARGVRRWQQRGSLAETVAIVGSGANADGFIQHLRRMQTRNVEVIGVFADDDEHPSLDRLLEIAACRRLDWIVLAIRDNEEQTIGPMLQRLQGVAARIALCPQLPGMIETPQEVDYVDAGLPAFLLADRPIKRWNVILKSLEDIVLSWLITLLLLPVFAVIALAIRLDSKGPIIFKQRRHAFNNTEFDIYKFRTMRWQTDQGAQAPRDSTTQTSRGDGRVTRVGRFLRDTSLDELPQLINVLRGEMSLIGPRPLAVDMRTEHRLCWEITDKYVHRHRVKPGITGWSQVNGSRGATQTAVDLKRRIELDLLYVDNWSLALDFKILLRTILVVVKRENAF